MKIVSLFCGAGGLDLGFKQAGFDIVWANDFDKNSTITYAQNFGDHVVHGDISKIDSSDIPDCDGIIGGPPCQGFSVAGKMSPNDPRSKLVSEFIRVVRDKKPKFFVMENVPNLVTNEKFSTLKDCIIKEFQDLGYNVCLEILNSKNYGAPQARERAIFIGTSIKLPLIPEIMFPEKINDEVSVREALLSIPYETRISKGFCNAKIVPAKSPVLRRSPYAGMLFNGQGRPLDLDRPSLTLTASMGGNKTPFIDEKYLNCESKSCWVESYHKGLMNGGKAATEAPKFLRRITVIEAMILQSFPLSHKLHGSQCSQYKQIGNSVPPKMSFALASSIKNCFEAEGIFKLTKRGVPKHHEQLAFV